MRRYGEFLKPAATMILPPLLGSGAFIAGKFGVAELSPLSLTFVRFLLAALVMVPLVPLFETKGWRLHREDWPLMFVVGLLGIPVYHVLFFLALQHTTAINAGLISATVPMMTSIFASVVLKERIGLTGAGAIALAFFGVALGVTGGNLGAVMSLSFGKGDTAMFGAVLAMAMYSVLSKKIMPRYSPLLIITYSFVIGVVILAPIAFIGDDLLRQLPHLSARAWGSIGYMAIGASSLAYFIQQVAIKRYGAANTMLFYNFVPFFCMMLAAIFLHERIYAFHLVSAAIISAGVYMYTTRK